MKSRKVDLSHLAASWGSSIVARDRIGEFTGGALSPGRMANIDSAGQGPQGRMRMGRRVVYPVDELIAWLEQRTQRLV